ncbi:MAG: glutamate--cysteine ligase [Gammaproteobacteria bacterium]|nr:glutamate--cysteine ligase [Gammaproteobacteria bacterium]
MSKGFDKRFDALINSGRGSISGGLKGIEKESLRIDAQGRLAQTGHPLAFGSALTNSHITTDFSEALLEFITPAFHNTWEAQQFLCDVHQFAYQNLDRELIWNASMPCRIPADAEIPLARYGNSNIGQMKTIYRRGLGYRYGRSMQTIAGVHFNYSPPKSFWPVYRDAIGVRQSEDEFRSEQYLGMVRNFRRFGWLILYLFGTSPAMCKSFAGNHAAGMPALNADTLFEPFGTSLRMSDLGYSNQNQARLNISLNSLEEYVHDLSAAVATPEPAYEKIGVKVDGKYRQLNANLLQIENEYYSSIRPKRVARSGERPTAALRRGGIEYVEIRSLDINVDDPAGINQNTMRLIEAFLIYCLIEDSPPLCNESLHETRRNQALTAKRGRDPEFRLQRDGTPTALPTWAGEILDKVDAIAAVFDADEGEACYAHAVRLAQSLVADPDATPSARLLHKLRAEKCSFFDFTLHQAVVHRDYFASIAPLTDHRQAMFEREARESIERQKAIEAGDQLSLDDYLAQYFSSD